MSHALSVPPRGGEPAWLSATWREHGQHQLDPSSAQSVRGRRPPSASMERRAMSGLHHAEGLHVELQDGFFLLPLGMVLLAQGDDLAQGLHVEAGAFGFGIDVLDIAGEAGLFLLQALDALDEALELVGGNRGGIDGG